MGCLVVSGRGTRYSEAYHHASISPDFILFGDAHLHPEVELVKSLSFSTDDLDAIFHDYGVFDSIAVAHPEIEQLLKTIKPGRDIRVGPNPLVQYFTGNLKIFKAETCLGHISVTLNPSWTLGSPKGVWIQNKFKINLEFSMPATFYAAMKNVYPLVRFLQMAIGRPQNVVEVSLNLPDLLDNRPNYINVYWTSPPTRDPRHE